MEEFEQELTPELLAHLEQMQEQAMADQAEKRRRLGMLGQKISKIRDDAVAWRKSCGIEDIWTEDEEYYEGADDLNRGQEKFLKPRSTSGGIISKQDDASTRCTAFFNLTRQFVDSAAARARDILLPANDWNFAIKPTPIPELEDIKGDETPAIVDQSGNPIRVGDIVQAKLADAYKKVENGEKRIKDWLVECGYKREYGKVIDAAAKCGTGILKGPYPIKRRSRRFDNGTLVITEDIIPASKYVSYWDFFPDPDCGEEIHNGSFVIERDFMTARQLRDLRGMPESGFIDEAINEVLAQGPNKTNHSDPSRRTSDDDRYEVWYYYGDIGKRDLALLDDTLEEEGLDDPEEKKDIEASPAVIVMVNDTVIKGHVSPLESGKFPFDMMVWQRVEGLPWGAGISRQGRVGQKMINSAARALMDNMGLSAIPMLALMRNALIPQDGSWELYPGKQFYIKESSGLRNAQEAIQPIMVPSNQVEAMNIIQLGKTLMEDATGVSFLLQGQQGSAPDTVGGMQLLHVNASAMLRRVAAIADDCVTKPHIKRYYDDWLMVYGDESEKGDATIEAIGSSALIERELQSAQLPQILQLALDPRFKKSPPKVFDEILKALRFEPGRFDMDQEELQELEQMMQNQPTAPQIEVAKINAQVKAARDQADVQLKQQELQLKQQEIRSDVDRDTIHIQAQTQRDQITYEARIAELQLKKELAMLEYASVHKTTLDKIKADLSKEVLKIQSTKELAAMNATADQLPKPPIEPQGIAPKGQSFTK
jgi:hypothetical protein